MNCLLCFKQWDCSWDLEHPGSSKDSPSINSLPLPWLSASAHLLPGVEFSASPLHPAPRKPCPAPWHCSPRVTGANTVMNAPIVYHLCKGFTLRFLWGQGNARSQLTTQWGRVKLCSFDSPRFGEPVCLVLSQQPGKQYSVRIPRQESSVPRASKAAVPEGDSVLPRGLPDGDVQSCRGSMKHHWGWQRLPGGLRRWASESGDGLLLLGPWHGDVDIMVTVPSEMWSKATYPITHVPHL